MIPDRLPAPISDMPRVELRSLLWREPVRQAVRKFFILSYVYRYKGGKPAVAIPDKQCSLESITPQLIDRVIQDEQLENRFLSLLEDGHQGLIATDSDQWIAYGWTHTPSSTAVPYHLPEWMLEMDLYWMFYARTKENYRGRGWHKYLLSQRVSRILETVPDADIFTDTVYENPSRFSMISVGFEPDGALRIYRAGHPAIGVKRYGRWDPLVDHPPLPST
ncbi:hypothetical protein ACLI4R_16445 [Natrialbaceae archaeon A-chndr2]